MGAVIESRGIVKAYGGVRALNGLDLRLGGGRLSAIIGPNGAGKTTLFNVLTGFARPEAGTISLDGRSIERLSPQRRAQLGLVRSFQVQQVFPALTVGETLTGAALLRAPLAEARRRARAICAELELPWEAQPAELAPGQARRLEFGRCLATRPRIILLDEVMAGLTSAEADFMAERVLAAHRAGVEIVVVEHVMEVIRRLCDEVHVLAGGRIIASGTFEEMARHPQVVEAYFGTRRSYDAA